MSRLFFENLIPGTVMFYRFELVRCLEATELGGIYLCHDRELGGRTTVIKIVSTMAEQIAGTDLGRELLLSQAVHHPNILSGREFFRDQDFVAYSMEFAEGGSLGDLLHEAPLSIGRVLDIAIQLAGALGALHAAGILHRDIKPENVLISASGDVRLADFGIAVYRGEHRHTAQGDRISGTMNYLAPEYLTRGIYDERSDIYSLAVLLYEASTGRMPFQGSSLIDTLQQRIRFDPPPPHLLNPGMPKQLSELLLGAMSREARFRPTSAAIFRTALEHVAATFGESDTTRSAA